MTASLSVWCLGSQGRHPQRQEVDAARPLRLRSETWLNPRPAVFPSTTRPPIQGRDGALQWYRGMPRHRQPGRKPGRKPGRARLCICVWWSKGASLSRAGHGLSCIRAVALSWHRVASRHNTTFYIVQPGAAPSIVVAKERH